MGGVGHTYMRGGVGHTWVGWVMQENNLKIDSPQNQDLTPPKSIFEGVQNPSFEYKKNKYIILLLQLYYIPNYIKKLLPDAPCIKNFNGMIITLVSREKSRKVACVLNGTEMLSTKATTNKNMPSPTLSRKQLIIICQKKRQNT